MLTYMQDKSKLLSYVVASGLTYGTGESIFHFLFKVNHILQYVLRLSIIYDIVYAGSMAW